MQRSVYYRRRGLLIFLFNGNLCPDEQRQCQQQQQEEHRQAYPAESYLSATESTDSAQYSLEPGTAATKLYLLSSSAALSMLNAGHGQGQEQGQGQVTVLPFELSEVEQRVVTHQGSVLLLGRSGSFSFCSYKTHTFLESELFFH